MPKVCVHNAKVSISVKGGQVLTKIDPPIPASTANKLKVEGKHVLTVNDIKNWLPQYMTDYINSAFVGGKAMGNRVTSEKSLTAKVKSTDPLLTEASIVEAQLGPVKPGQNPQGVPDGVFPINVIIQFTDPGQTKADFA